MMTTTAVGPHCAFHRDGDLLSCTFKIKQRLPGELPPSEDGEQIGVMRRLTWECLSARGLTHLADNTVLVVSELVTNAILHSGGWEITVTLSLRNGFLRIDVRDGAPSSHGPREASDDAGVENGRGLLLVQLLAEAGRGAWGTEDGGANTWCELSSAACR